MPHGDSEVSVAGARRAITTSVRRLAPENRTPAQVQAIEKLAASSFDEQGFSIEQELERPWGRVWTAEQDVAIVGFLVAWHVADELHVLNIAVASPHRRQGVATELMADALDYAAAEHIRIVLLEVRRSNRAALRLYRSLSFSAMGVRPGYYGDNGEDAVEMVLALDPMTGARLPAKDEVRIEV